METRLFSFTGNFLFTLRKLMSLNFKAVWVIKLSDGTCSSTIHFLSKAMTNAVDTILFISEKAIFDSLTLLKWWHAVWGGIPVLLSLKKFPAFCLSIAAEQTLMDLEKSAMPGEEFPQLEEIAYPAVDFV
jgi:hypothetical protein